jgi:hypothetical protein
MVADLGLRGGGTIYTRIGEVFGWLCVACAVWMLAWRALRARRPSRSD